MQFFSVVSSERSARVSPEVAEDEHQPGPEKRRSLTGSSGSDPQGKRRPQRSGERLMVVRPCSSTRVLTGRTLLNTACGRRLLGMRWPLRAAGLAGAVLGGFARSGLCTDARAYEGLGGRAVLLSVRSPVGHVLEAASAACYLAVLVLLAHGVHVQLLRLTLMSFDPWVTIVCLFRAVASWIMSRARLTGDGSQDVAVVITTMEWAVLWLVLETVELPRLDKTAILVVSLLLCAVMLLPTLPAESMNWDPDAVIDIWWLAPMTLKSQFISAVCTMFIYHSKAFLNFTVLGRSFMFLRAHFTLEVERLDVLFQQLDLDGDGKVSYADWQGALGSLHIPANQLQAGFNLLDVGSSRRISFTTFERFLGERCRANSGVSHTQHLVCFCQEAWVKASHTMPLLKMIEEVLAQWSRVQLRPLSTELYNHLLENDRLRAIFTGKSMAAQASMFGAFVAMGLQWLDQCDFLKLEVHMLELGERHAKYGVGVSMLSTFQVSLFSALQAQLGSAFSDLKHEWALLWMHFITGPFVRGLARGRGWRREEMLRQVYCHWQQFPSSGAIIDHLFEELFRLSPDTEQMFPGSRLATHKMIITNFLGMVLQDLSEGNAQRARIAIRDVAAVHWERGVSLLHLAHFQEAFLRALRIVYGQECSEQCLEAWAWVLQLEVIEGFLMAPFAEVEDSLNRNVACDDADEVAPLDLERWMAIFDKLDVPDALIKTAFEHLRLQHPVWLTTESVKAAVLSESMMRPGCSCKQVVEDWCEGLASRDARGPSSFEQKSLF